MNVKPPDFVKEGRVMIRHVGLGIAGAVFALGLLSTVPAHAGSDCRRILKFLDTGRTPEDIAETMMISVDQIKECQEEAAKAKAAEGAAGGGGENKEAAPSH